MSPPQQLTVKRRNVILAMDDQWRTAAEIRELMMTAAHAHRTTETRYGLVLGVGPLYRALWELIEVLDYRRVQQGRLRESGGREMVEQWRLTPVGMMLRAECALVRKAKAA